MKGEPDGDVAVAEADAEAFLEGDPGKSLAQRCFSASKAAYDLGRYDGYYEGCDDGWFRGKYGERVSNETEKEGDRDE